MADTRPPRSPPTLRVVSGRTSAEVEAERDRVDRDVGKQHAAQQLEWALRELAANLMRVVRGAGDPGRIAIQCREAIEG